MTSPMAYVYPGRRGLKAAVHYQAPLGIECHTKLPQSQALYVWAAADRDEDAVALNGARLSARLQG
jgi:hypothetical protein